MEASTVPFVNHSPTVPLHEPHPNALRPPSGTGDIARHPAISTIAILAVFFTLYLARDFLLPVVLAFVLALVFRPIVRAMERVRIPAPLTALVIMCGFVGGIGYGLNSLYEPAMGWLNRAPDAFTKVERKFRQFRAPMEDAGRAAERMERLANPDRGPQVEIKPPGLGNRIVSGAFQLITSFGVVLFLLFFLLATGGRLMSRIAAFILVHRPRSQPHVELMGAIESNVSQYLGTISVINALLGAAVGAAFWLLQMPNPVLWGVMVAFLNFVPYIGGAVGVTIVTLASVLAFDEPWRMLAVPAVYMSLNIMEGMLITPAILGRRFSVDPCFVFVWLVFWSWMWGIPGGLLAMPMLAAIRITSEHVPSWNAFGRLISAERSTR